MRASGGRSTIWLRTAAVYAFVVIVRDAHTEADVTCDFSLPLEATVVQSEPATKTVRSINQISTNRTRNSYCCPYY